MDPAPVFDEEIVLRGARIQRDETRHEGDQGLHVTLWWEALTAPGADYTVFVHLVDGGGQLVGTGDGPPLAGAFPTPWWRPGDIVEDVHQVLVPEGQRAGSFSVRVGWYDAVSGTRLSHDLGDYVVLPGVSQTQ
jgi:hypothetical protein